jgi:hypothetical protein
MSLPSQAVFEKDGKIIHKVFVNCGWFHNGDETTVEVLYDIYNNSFNQKECYFPEDYDRVIIYDSSVTKEEVDFIIERSIAVGKLKRNDIN